MIRSLTVPLLEKEFQELAGRVPRELPVIPEEWAEVLGDLPELLRSWLEGRDREESEGE